MDHDDSNLVIKSCRLPQPATMFLCGPELAISLSFIGCAFGFFGIVVMITKCYFVPPPREDRIESVDDFRNLVQNGHLTIPFQVAVYGPLRLYTHHIVVTGYAPYADDYLLTTVEYVGIRNRGWNFR